MGYKQGISFNFTIKNKATFEALKSRMEHPALLGDYSPAVTEISITRPPHSSEDTQQGNTVYEIFVEDGVRILGKDGGHFIRLGSGRQSVLSILGSPEALFKEGEFYNYFKSGIDIKFEYDSVEKIILHSNLPGHHLFGRYDRAWFEFDSKNKNAKRIDNTSKIKELINTFGDPGPPVIVDDHPCGLRYYYNFSKSLTVETNPEGFIASIAVCRSGV